MYKILKDLLISFMCDKYQKFYPELEEEAEA